MDAASEWFESIYYRYFSLWVCVYGHKQVADFNNIQPIEFCMQRDLGGC